MERCLGTLRLSLGAVLLLMFPAISEASHEFLPCKPVKSECVAIVDIYDDGVYWIADRIEIDGYVFWDPIKKADCPHDSDYHLRKEYGWDPKYGNYACLYDEVHERPSPDSRRGRFIDYVVTHKSLLASDGVLILSALADASSAAHCQQVSRSCIEKNALLGPHPSAGTLYGTKLSITAGLIAVDHYWVHEFKESPPNDGLYLFWWSAFVGENFYGTLTNVNTAGRLVSSPAEHASNLRRARERLMQDPPVD
jgi:hypothetical protein